MTLTIALYRICKGWYLIMSLIFLDNNRNSIILPILIFLLLFFSFFIFSPLALSQGQADPELKFTSSLNPVGSGARALAMGGAFIGSADDATAASWNPAGLKHLLRPEISMVINYEKREESFYFEKSPDASNQYEISGFHHNYFSLAYPFRMLNRNFVVSLNYQTLYNLNREMEFRWNYGDPNGIIDMGYDVKYRQEGRLKAISPAMAVFLTQKLFFGFTLNFWSAGFSDNGWVEEYRKIGQGTVSGRDYKSNENRADKFSFDGFNTNIGFLWDINRFFTVGGVIKTPFTANIGHEGKSLINRIYTDDSKNNTNEYEPILSDDQKLKMPLSCGIGVAMKPTDRFIIDFDIYMTKWNDYALIDSSGDEINPITGELKEDGDSIDSTFHLRLGAEYIFILKKNKTLTIRLGTFYDPEPAVGLPDQFLGFSFGTGFTFGNFAIDLAYQYRFGKNAEGDSIKGEYADANVKHHLIYNSAIYYF